MYKYKYAKKTLALEKLKSNKRCCMNGEVCKYALRFKPYCRMWVTAFGSQCTEEDFWAMKLTCRLYEKANVTEAKRIFGIIE